jgi:hypothetical protein
VFDVQVSNGEDLDAALGLAKVEEEDEGDIF